MGRLTVWVVVVAMVLGAPGGLGPVTAMAQGQEGPGGERTSRITVGGTGRVAVAPDMAILRLGVAARAPEASAAMADAGARLQGVLEALATAGVAPEDMQTERFYLQPVVPYNASGRQQEIEIAGYTAESTLSVRIRDLDGLGGVIDAVTAAGGNSFNGLEFALADPAPSQEAARIAAVKDAMAKAEVMAEAAGLALGAVVHLREGGMGGGGPQPMMEAAAMRSMPVAQGELEITASVAMVFDLVAGE